MRDNMYARMTSLLIRFIHHAEQTLKVYFAKQVTSIYSIKSQGWQVYF